MQLTPEQALIITAIVVPLLVQGFKLFLAATGKEVNRFGITIIVFVVSAGLGYWWISPSLPTATDPMVFATELVVILGSVIGFATLIYNLILSKLFDALGWTKARMLK